jgi:predicted nucleic acid-binding protein
MAKKLVIDTSVTLKWLAKSNEQRLQQANAILEDIQQKKIVAYLPVIADYEVGNALLKGKKLNPRHAAAALELYYQLPLQRIPLTTTLAAATYKFAHQYNLTFYDAAFVAAAHLLDAVLITDNPKHQGRPKEIAVIPLADYTKS